MLCLWNFTYRPLVQLFRQNSRPVASNFRHYNWTRGRVCDITQHSMMETYIESSLCSQAVTHILTNSALLLWSYRNRCTTASEPYIILFNSRGWYRTDLREVCWGGGGEGGRDWLMCSQGLCYHFVSRHSCHTTNNTRDGKRERKLISIEKCDGFYRFDWYKC